MEIVGRILIFLLGTMWIWLSVVYIVSFIFCLIKFRRQIKKNNIDTENIPNHEIIRRIVEINREKNSDGGLLSSEERDFLNENWEEISARIGKKNIEYINRFYGKKRKINWASGLFNQSWLCYRGMLKEYLIFLILSFSIQYVMIVVIGTNLTYYITVIINFLFFAMYGDYYYFRSLQKRITHKKGEISKKLALYFIIINSLFPIMIVFSWFIFIFGGGLQGIWNI